MGWVLLTAGILIIAWALYLSYSIFTGKTEPPQIFGQIESAPAGQQEEVKRMVAEQIKNMIPPLFISRILNLISWSIFMGIMIFGGSKVSLLGIRLVRGRP